MRAWLLVLLFSGCTERALSIEDDAGARVDLAHVDLAHDLESFDMTRPHYCDGIYVIDRNATLLFFDPAKLTFTTIATVACPDPGFGQPFSMALDRTGTAWVVYDDGNLFRVDTDTGACEATSFVPGQHGFTTFGAGFASDSAGSKSETYFIDSDDDRLARIDVPTLTVHPIATLPAGQSAELTGTGDGELWGFFRQAMPHMGRIDKQTGAIGPDFALPQLGDISQDAFAFGFFGGSFYAFLGASSTDVVRIDAATGTPERVLSNTGLLVVGAGVSTCAPTQ